MLARRDNFRPDPRLAEAKLKPIQEVADSLDIRGLKKSGSQLRSPCPVCGGRDPFSINIPKGVFYCHVCVKGGDQLALVMHVLSCDFKAALSWLCGDAPANISPEETSRRHARIKAQRENQARESEEYDRKRVQDARKIWKKAQGQPLHMVQQYLLARGIIFVNPNHIPLALRSIPHHSYAKQINNTFTKLHFGPCMVAAIQGANGKHCGTHQTWITPEGKAKITHDGSSYPSKLVRGMQKGGAIRLSTPRGATTLIMAEGIENALTAMVVNDDPRAAYWAGINLGNMSGRMLTVKGVKYSGQPDMDDIDAFVAPPWVERLIYIMDGDSEPCMTRAKLTAGLRRSMAIHPHILGVIVKAPKGMDLNDMIRGV